MQNKQTYTPLQETKPLVTFIITYYNLSVAMLTECIESLLALSLKPTEREIIVIDDGSDVSPINDLSRYGSDIIYIRQHNQGLSQARNAGLRIATGDYIQFVDADDYLLREPYEHCLNIARHQHPDMVLFDFTHDENNDAAVFSTNDVLSGAEFMCHQNLHAAACVYLFRKTILGELRFTPGIYHEDEEFTPQLMLRADTLCSTDAQAYFYRRRSQSITSDANVRNTIKRLVDKRRVISRLALMADTMPMTERVAMNRRVAQLTMDYIYNVIVQTRSRHYLDRKLDSLRREGLFPLPDRDYTTKYKWFRRMTSNSLGLSILMQALPLMSKER